MTIGRILEDGTIERGQGGQGNIYYNPEAFDKKEGTCYVPELSDYQYTYKDFLDEAKGSKQIAAILFDTVDWQSPSALYGDLVSSNEIIECKNCNTPYLTQGLKNAECPYCVTNIKKEDEDFNVTELSFNSFKEDLLFQIGECSLIAEDYNEFIEEHEENKNITFKEYIEIRFDGFIKDLKNGHSIKIMGDTYYIESDRL